MISQDLFFFNEKWMHEFLQMPVNINLLAIILNTEILSCVISTDGPFYYNDGSEVAEDTMTASWK